MTAGRIATGTVLDRILEQTAIDVEIRRARVPLAELQRRARERPASAPLKEALTEPGMSVIAEFKRASPSRGVFPVEIEPVSVVSAYLEGDAAAISVLTDEPFFKGSLADLELAVSVARSRPKPVPVLRKDFMLDPYQVVEAKAYGADVILLIVAALEQPLLKELYALATELGLSVLVEVHDEAEMERALSLNADIIGINNRDLRDFTVDLATTERLAPMAPAGTTLIGESGIFTVEDVWRLEDAGVQAVLVGEGLITQPDRAAAVRALRVRR